MNLKFPLRLFGSIPYYAAMSRCSFISFDTAARYNKAEKDTHRFAIADTRGLLRLTVPVSRQAGATLWRHVTVSDHGRWWETMPIALESAYGRTPYFEFYIDRLRPLFSPEPVSVPDLCLAADAHVRRMLDIRATVLDPGSPEALAAPLLSPIEGTALPPYWQVRAHELGFIGGLSILDLIFNLGPDAQIYLQQLSTTAVENPR